MAYKKFIMKVTGVISFIADEKTKAEDTLVNIEAMREWISLEKSLGHSVIVMESDVVAKEISSITDI
jgi:hypothetical protein